MLKALLKVLYSRLRPIEAAKKAGAHINGQVSVTGAVDFGSEPWLVTVEDGVLLTQHVTFLTHDGCVSTIRKLDPQYANLQKFGKIHIKDNVCLGAYSYIMPNITIGKNSIVGACSVVIDDVPDNTVVAGIPAKAICST